MESIITLRGVSKRYEGSTRPALDAIDLDIEARARSRRSWARRAAASRRCSTSSARLDRPTPARSRWTASASTVSSETAAARFRRAKVGFVFQFFHLLEDLTVRENVAVPADPRGSLPGRGATGAPTRCSPSSAWRSAARKFPATLSGGERQRLAIARAVINDPAVLLADEPTGALDRRNGEAALAILEDLNRRGQTILLVTHDERWPTQTAHRTMRLIDGTIADDGRSRMVA